MDFLQGVPTVLINESIERLEELIALTEHRLSETEPPDAKAYCLHLQFLRAHIHLAMAQVHESVGGTIRVHAAETVRPLKAVARRSRKRI
jgi:hypothetical protein